MPYKQGNWPPPLEEHSRKHSRTLNLWYALSLCIINVWIQLRHLIIIVLLVVICLICVSLKQHRLPLTSLLLIKPCWKALGRILELSLTTKLLEYLGVMQNGLRATLLYVLQFNDVGHIMLLLFFLSFMFKRWFSILEFKLFAVLGSIVCI